MARLRRSLISCTMGPGVKIYRGELQAEENTIAFACRGANVVANGGRVLLRRNEIRGAMGDGITAWNDAQVVVEGNRIHSNSGSGIGINSVGGQVSVRAGNHVFANAKSVLLGTSSAHQVALEPGNSFDDDTPTLRALQQRIASAAAHRRASSVDPWC